ncbi:MAG: site-specific integrase [Thermoplasmata archaeon]|nr:site-specific integrase [Thermoplasmata archaeon]
MTGQKDPLASRPFSDEDARAITAEADLIVTVHRDRSYDQPWFGRLVRVLLAFGMHISVISGGYRRKTDPKTREVLLTYYPPLSSQDIRSEGGEVYLVWRRPKTQRPVMVPVPADIRPWLAEWLDAPRRTQRTSYNHLFNQLADDLARKGLSIQINPLRFRHTAAVRFIHEYEMTPDDTCELLGVSPSVLAQYTRRAPGEMAKDLRSRGW